MSHGYSLVGRITEFVVLSCSNDTPLGQELHVCNVTVWIFPWLNVLYMVMKLPSWKTSVMNSGCLGLVDQDSQKIGLPDLLF